MKETARGPHRSADTVACLQDVHTRSPRVKLARLIITMGGEAVVPKPAAAPPLPPSDAPAQPSSNDTNGALVPPLPPAADVERDVNPPLPPDNENAPVENGAKRNGGVGKERGAPLSLIHI